MSFLVIVEALLALGSFLLQLFNLLHKGVRLTPARRHVLGAALARLCGQLKSKAAELGVDLDDYDHDTPEESLRQQARQCDGEDA